MPRHRRMLAPIHSEKHMQQTSLATVAAGAATGVEIIVAVAVADKNLVKEVTEGSVIKAVYVELWVKGLTDDGDGTVIVIVEKTEADKVGATFTEMTVLNDYVNKKNILYTFMGLVPSKTTSPPLPVVRGWIKIPKGKQRFGLGDRLHIRIASQVDGVEFCGQNIFKEYS